MDNQQAPWTIFIILGVGTLLLLLLLSFFFLFIRIHLRRVRAQEEEKYALQLAHQETLSKALIATQEQERARVAGELHDNLIGDLYRANLLVKNPKLRALLAQSIHKARALSHELSPPLLELITMPELLQDYLEPFESKYQVSTNFSVGENKTLHKDVKLQIFRIFQEIVTNIDKYAQANVINVNYRAYKDYTCLLVQDNGVGLPSNYQPGLGMKNISLRAQLLRSQYKFKSPPLGGTTFILLKYE